MPRADSPARARPRRVIFVCLGNICRSPAGHGIMRQLVAAQGLDDRVQVDSAGTLEHMAGTPPDPRMKAAAARRGYHLDGHARAFSRADFDRFDLVVAMDRSNREDLHALDPAGQYRDKVKLLSAFLPPSAPPDVPDPYHGGPEGFERVLDLIEAACPAILYELLPER